MMSHTVMTAIIAMTFHAALPVHAGPEPVLTEVLFNVPRGDAGDANADGYRGSAGDEFFELSNPHDEAIDLRGYTFANRLFFRRGSEGRAVRFIFPKFELGPGETVVVFNGHDAEIPGPVGTSERAPRETNESFGGAWVFTMGNTSQFRAMNNSGDYVLLLSPKKKVVDGLMWGRPDEALPEGASVPQKVSAEPDGSVTRALSDEPFARHKSVDGARFSPGVQVSS